MDFGKIFSADGRVGRKDWIIWIVAIWIILGIIGWILGVYDDDGTSITYSILSIIAGIASIFMGIKRLHDLDKTGWLYLLTIVPLVNLVFWIYLIVWKGTDGDNKYGSPNSGSPFNF